MNEYKGLALAIETLYKGNCDDWIIEGNDNVENIVWVKKPSNVVPTNSEIQSKYDEILANELIEEKEKSFNDFIQKHLDTKAQSLRYDNINSIGKYVGYENDFRTEAEKLGTWASSCWKVAGEIEIDVKDGKRELPTSNEVINELPIYE